MKRKKGQDTCFGNKRALAAQSLSEGLGPTPHCDNHSVGIKPREDDPLGRCLVLSRAVNVPVYSILAQSQHLEIELMIQMS